MMLAHLIKIGTMAVCRFRQSRDGAVAMTFALALIPMVVAVGAAVDYSRANAFKTVLQTVLDTSLLAGAKDGSSSWSTVALNTFTANIAGKTSATLTPTFTTANNVTYDATVSAAVPTSFLGVINVHSMTVTAKATAQASPGDNSCILTLDKGQPLSHVGLVLNGAPVINLAGCSIRTNTGLNCNGHDGNATKSIAAGTASGCANPTSNAPAVPDIYTDLAKNITPKCGTLKSGFDWAAGSIPATGPAFIRVTVGDYTEYHVCGDLNLSGTGALTGGTPASDVIIVIENGSLNIANNASISTSKTAIVMTGDATAQSKINFPNGNGKEATLNLSPPTDAANPWQGVALYQDPKLTNHGLIDNTWGPGMNFNADGLVYLGNSNVTTDGDTSSNNSRCTKFVMNQFTTNGHVDLNFQQTNCSAIGLKQWGGITVHLTK